MTFTVTFEGPFQLLKTSAPGYLFAQPVAPMPGVYLWTYPTTRAGSNVPEVWVRGRVMGGSSSVNGMFYTRGEPEDYDNWEANGCTGWGWRRTSWSP